MISTLISASITSSISLDMCYNCSFNHSAALIAAPIAAPIAALIAASIIKEHGILPYTRETNDIDTSKYTNTNYAFKKMKNQRHTILAPIACPMTMMVEAVLRLYV